MQNATELPRGREQDYMRAFGVASVYAATCNGRPTAIVATHDPHRSVTALEHRFGQRLDVSCVYWVQGRREANFIVRRVRCDLFGREVGRMFDVSAEEAERAIRSAAQGIRLTKHEAAIARAKANAERLDLALEQAQREGMLKFFNRSYRRYRQRGAGPVMTYPQARARLRYVLAGMIGHGAVCDVTNPAILQRVFPGL